MRNKLHGVCTADPLHDKSLFTFLFGFLLLFLVYSFWQRSDLFWPLFWVKLFLVFRHCQPQIRLRSRFGFLGTDCVSG